MSKARRLIVVAAASAMAFGGFALLTAPAAGAETPVSWGRRGVCPSRGHSPARSPGSCWTVSLATLARRRPTATTVVAPRSRRPHAQQMPLPPLPRRTSQVFPGCRALARPDRRPPPPMASGALARTPHVSVGGRRQFELGGDSGSVSHMA
jgi:hypothetical protein